MDSTTVVIVVVTLCMGGAVIAFTAYLLRQVLPELRALNHEPAPQDAPAPVKVPWWRRFFGG